MINNKCESFQIRYCITFNLKGHQNYQKSKLKIPKSLHSLSKVESLNLQVVAVLMPLEIKCHTLPHLKALAFNIECRSGHGQCITFKQHYTLEGTILLHKWPKQRFHVTIVVYQKSTSCWHSKGIFSLSK